MTRKLSKKVFSLILIYVSIISCVISFPIFSQNISGDQNFQNKVITPIKSSDPLYLDNEISETIGVGESVEFYLEVPATTLTFLISTTWDIDLKVTVANDASFSDIIHTNDNPGYQVDEIFQLSFTESKTIYIKVESKVGSGFFKIWVGGGQPPLMEPLNLDNEISGHLWDDESIEYYLEVPAKTLTFLVSTTWDMDLKITVANDVLFSNIIHTNDNPGYHVDELFQLTFNDSKIIYIRVESKVGSGYFDIMVSPIESIPLAISNPDDIAYNFDSSGNFIIWVITDNFSPNPTYIIYRNEIEIASGTWISDSDIYISIDGLSPGEFLYKIEALDGKGNSITDEVMVKVKEKLNIHAFPIWNFTIVFLVSISILKIKIIKRKNPKQA